MCRKKLQLENTLLYLVGDYNINLDVDLRSLTADLNNLFIVYMIVFSKCYLFRPTHMDFVFQTLFKWKLWKLILNGSYSLESN